MNKKEFQPEIFTTTKSEQLNLIEKLKENPPIILLEEKSEITSKELKEKFPNYQLIIACDFNVADIEKNGKRKGNFFEIDGIINIDHHIPIKDMEKYISSTNLAIEYVKKNGIFAGEDKVIVINHTDCDSVLSAGILRGILPPEERFGEAAIAADHTGAENPIADLLQSFHDKRKLEFSLRNLQLFLENKPLEEEAILLLNKRLEDRKRAKEIVESGFFKKIGIVSFTILDEKIDAGLLPPLLPQAKIIMIASRLETNPKKWEIKLRLGNNVSEGLKLDKEIIKKLDPNYGGRWNAGNNKRGGGTNIDPEKYATKLNEIFKKSFNL